MQRLLHAGRLAAGRPPGVGDASGASSSGRAHAAPPAMARPTRHGPAASGRRERRQLLLPPCRITSTSKELFESDEAKEMGFDDPGEDTYMDLPDVQVFDPELGPLEKRVQRSFLEAIQDDRIDLRDTEYWFSQPEGNWSTKPKRVTFMEEDEEDECVPTPWHDPEEGTRRGEREEGITAFEDRIAWDELEEGRVLMGVVTDVWLYHGVQVDVGAQCDGLIPCTEAQWELAVDHIDVGEVVWVEVHKLRQPGFYRWPLQLKFAVRGLQDLMMRPDDYDAPIDYEWAEAQGMSTAATAAHAGRGELPIPTYFLPPDATVQAEEVIDGYGTGRMPWRSHDSPPLEDYIDDPLEDEAAEGMERSRVDELAAAWDPASF